MGSAGRARRGDPARQVRPLAGEQVQLAQEPARAVAGDDRLAVGVAADDLGPAVQDDEEVVGRVARPVQERPRPDDASSWPNSASSASAAASSDGRHSRRRRRDDRGALPSSSWSRSSGRRAPRSRVEPRTLSHRDVAAAVAGGADGLGAPQRLAQDEGPLERAR